MKLFLAIAAAALFIAPVLASSQSQAIDARRQQSGAIRYYDAQGNDRGYTWCLNGDCSYYTRSQCEGSKILGRGWCRVNPYAVDASRQPKSIYR